MKFIGFLWYNWYFPFELIGAMLVFALPLEKRRRFSKDMLRSIIGILCVLACLEVLSSGMIRDVDIGTIQFGWLTMILCFRVFLYMLTAIWLICKVSLSEALYCATCAYMIEHIAYSIRLLLNWMVGENIAEPVGVLYILIHVGVYIVAYFIFTKPMIQDKHYTTRALKSIGLMMSALFMVIVMSVFAGWYEFMQIHAIYALFSCSFVLFSQVKAQKQFRLQEELGTQQQLWIKHKVQYELSRENIERINQRCHDLKHQVAALRTIGDLEAQQEAIDSIEASVMIYDAILETGHHVLDTVLTEKSLLCQTQGINLTCIVDGKKLQFMDAIDLYTLFGNALDNAIEGVIRLHQTERFINLQVLEKKDMLFIQFENPYDGNIYLVNGMPSTIKTDNFFHGYGLKSIHQITEKYKGFLTIETAENMFVVRIMIPIDEHDKLGQRKNSLGHMMT